MRRLKVWSTGLFPHKDEFPQTVSTDCFTPFVHALSHTPVSAYRAGQTQTGEVPGSEPQGGVSTHISYFHTPSTLTLDFF